MSKITEWTEELIQYARNKHDEGYTWSQISKEINKNYDLTTKGDNVRKAVSYYYEASGEDLTIKNLASTRRSQIAATESRKNLRDVLDDINIKNDFVLELNKLLKSLPKISIPVIKPIKMSKKDRHMTVEALFSDLQIGKLSPDFNLKIAKERIKRYTDGIIFKITQHRESGYHIDEIVLCLLGDIIESLEKATKKGSPTSCEVGTPEQMRLSIEWLWLYLLVPLSQLGAPITVLCIPGNHDGVENGMTSFKAGKELLTWPIYQSLKLLCEATELTNITFKITEGVFMTHTYYGQKAIYEHGYKIPVSVAGLQGRLNDRCRQTREHITYFRMGDKHSVSRFNEDTLIVNGAFFGCKPSDLGEEYSSVQGYSARAAQLVLFHVPRKKEDDRLTIYDSFLIQLNHITGEKK